MNRFNAVTQKVSREATGMNGSMFVHLEFDSLGRPWRIWFSEKKKDDNQLDRILRALGDAATEALRSGPLWGKK